MSMGVGSARAARLLLAAAALAAGLFTRPAAAQDAGRPQQRIERASAVWPAEPFALVDAEGRAYTHERLQGRWTFVVFAGGGDGHGGCGALCPQALAALDGMLRRIAGTEALKTTQVLYVALDGHPQRRPALHDARSAAVAGAPRTLARLADDLTVTRADTAPPAGGAPRGIVLVGPDGSARAEYLAPWDVKLMTADYLKTRLRR
jgi:hypothetical protein